MNANTTIKIQRELAHQEVPLQHRARFKAWPWGRRAGKNIGALIGSTVGHGPPAPDPDHRIGFLEGGDILWIARDYTQARAIWYKEVKKRFSNKPGFTVSEKYRTITINDGSGSFRVGSADNIDSERGDHWDGVVIDEAAFVDLEYIFGQVVRPGLADTKGWAIIMGTTWPSSYFNTLCDQIESGERAGDWVLHERTAKDNPKIDNEEFQKLVDSYGADEVALQCEVYAKRTVKGGYAFREWDETHHVAKVQNFPDSWLGIGTMDWGYVQPGYFGYARLGPAGQVYFRYDYKFEGMDPKAVGKSIGAKMKGFASLPHDNPDFHPLPLYIVADAQMWMKSESAITVADQVMEGIRAVLGEAAPMLVPALKGPESRTIGKVMVHQHLEVPMKDGAPDPNNPPKLRFHPDCEYPIRGFPKLPRDPVRLEDVDTKADDHFYDAIRYLLTMQKPVADNSIDRVGIGPDKLTRQEQRRRRKQRQIEQLYGGGYELDEMVAVEPDEFWTGEHDTGPGGF